MGILGVFLSEIWRKMRERQRKIRYSRYTEDERPPSRSYSEYSHHRHRRRAYESDFSDEEISVSPNLNLQRRGIRNVYLSDSQMSPMRQNRNEKRHRRHSHKRRSLPDRYHAPYPAGHSRLSHHNEPILDDASRSLIRRVALATLIASGAVCLICIISKWKENNSQSRFDSWIEQNSFWHDFLYNQFSCSGVGIASVIVALLFV